MFRFDVEEKMKKIFFIVTVIICSCTKTLLAQNAVFNWANGFGSTDSDIGRFIASDDSGNIYAIGTFAGTVDFDPDTGVYNLTTMGGTYGFVCKFSSSGSVVWAKSMDFYGNSVTVDKSGNVLVTGAFYGTIDFNPGAGTFNMTAMGAEDAFILKLDYAGNFLWAKQFGYSGNAASMVICTDGENNIYTSGNFDNIVDLNPGISSNLFYSLSGADMYLSKLDSSGSFVWAKQIGGNGTQESKSITIDDSANIYLTGNFYDNVDFDPDTGTCILDNSMGTDAFVAKFDSSSHLVWAKKFWELYKS